jgi:Leucine Rich repeat
MSTSEKNIEALRKTIEEQKKILNFFQSKYREQTGSELELPQTWSKFLSISEANAPLVDEGDRLFQSSAAGLGGIDRSHLGRSALQGSAIGMSHIGHSNMSAGYLEGRNFLQNYYDLKLPKKKPDTKQAARSSSNAPNKSTATSTSGAKKSAAGKKKKEVTTTFDEKNQHHLVEKIDLSDFQHSGFSRAGFREFLEGIEDMRCLTTVILRNNGISDEHLEELEILFSNERIKKIDLSGNAIGKQGALAIARKMKEVSHIEWLE